MKAAQLRQSILQAAVQGKLVPQDIHDEPADKLLERIRAEKARLVKEGKIKREKLLPPITEDDAPYDLPDGWVWCRLGEVCIKLTDGAHSTPKYVDVGIPFLSVKDISAGRIDFSATKYISKAEHDELYKRCDPKKGDILLTKVGTTGIPVVVNTDREFSLFVSVALLRISSDNCNLQYLCHLIKSPLVYLQSQENTRGVGNKNWVLTAIANTIIALPPLAEQQRIVTKVDELMALCDELEVAEKELDKLEADFAEYLPKSILQAAVQGKLVPQNIHDEPADKLLERICAEKARLIKEGKIKKEKSLPPIAEDELPYDLPDGWAWCRLGNLVQLINGDRGKNYPSKDKLTMSGIPFISAVNIEDGSISTAKLLCVNQEQYNLLGNGKLQKNDIVFCIRGSLGKCGIYPFEQGAIASSLVILRRYSFDDLRLDYLMSYLSTSLLDDEMRKYDNGTAQPNLSAENLKSFLFPLPPLAEQQRIVAKVDELMALCDDLKAAKDISLAPTKSRITPFPTQEADDVEEIRIAARGDVHGLSDEAMRDIDELFGDDVDD